MSSADDFGPLLDFVALNKVEKQMRRIPTRETFIEIFLFYFFKYFQFCISLAQNFYDFFLIESKILAETKGYKHYREIIDLLFSFIN